MNITELLKRNAITYADEIAIKHIKYIDSNHSTNNESVNQNNKVLKQTLTWKQFNIRANKVANLLIDLGIKKNDKVAILLPNCLEWLPLYFGILKIGAIAVPLNYRFDSKELGHCLSCVNCSVVFTSIDYDELIRETIKNLQPVPCFVFLEKTGVIPEYSKSYMELMCLAKESSPLAEINDEDNAAIYFTSGTTGMPKAILLSHKALMAACDTEKNHHFQVKEDIFLCIPPLYHTGAKMHWFGSLAAGGSMVLLGNISPRYILETISNEKISIVWLLVPWAQDILAAIECGDININHYDFSNWRLTHMGAQPISATLIKKWLMVFPMQSYDTNYGLSEAAGPGCVHLGLNNIHKVGAIGKAGYGWETSIVDENGKKVKNNVIGELMVKGPGLMVGYYNDIAATDKVLKNGWLLTGDMAYEDTDNFIYLVGRKKDIIISGGENISAVQIENYIYQHHAVKDVAVIGIQNERVGEMVAAVIELKPNIKCSKLEILKFCEGLPDYKRPRKIIFAQIPRNSTGKIEKVKLRQLYS